MRDGALFFGFLVFTSTLSICLCQEEKVGEKLATYDECGGYLDEAKGLVSTPNYPKSNEEINQTYSENLSCVWYKNSSSDRTLFVVKIWDMIVENAPLNKLSNKTICYDYLNITISSIGEQQYCGWKAPEGVIKGLGSYLKILFHSDHSGNYRGVMITYTSFLNFDACAHNTCSEGECTVDENMVDYRCICFDGYTGTDCDVDIDECSSYPCKNGGTCTELKKSGYFCLCPEFWSGSTCEYDIRSNPCDSNPCFGSSTCEWTPQRLGFGCICPIGFSGKVCDKEVEDCSKHPCQNGGSCIDRTDSYECVCSSGWTGQICDEVVDPCISKPCKKNEVCNWDERRSSYRCECKNENNNISCAFLETICGKFLCENGGNCIYTENKYYCKCQSGFTGNNCEHENQLCPNPGIPYISQDLSWAFGSTLMFFCAEGYRLQGSENLTCQRNQTWSNKMPICIDVENRTSSFQSKNMSPTLLSFIVLSVMMAAVLIIFSSWLITHGPWMCRQQMTKVMQLTSDSISIL